jgi:hypothetical protein
VIQRATSILAAAACCLLFAQPVRAASIPDGARVRVDRTIDLQVFERTVVRKYHVTFDRVIAADIDRDGDLDVLASTDHDFVVWVNDGQGHLTSQAPTRASALDGSPGASTWDEGEARRDESIQNDLPSSGVPGVYAHGPPSAAIEYRCADIVGLRLDSVSGCQIPRAPPA